SELTSILAVQGKNGGFFWELYKPAGNAANVDVTTAAQQICKAALGATTPRCTGVIPPIGGVTPTSTSAVTGTVSVRPTSTTPPTSTDKVSYQGRQYTCQWWSQNNVPTAGGPWTDNGACSGGATPTPGTGSCAGVSPYSSATAYSGGAKVTYGGFIYTAQWWTQGETPGTAAAWVKGAACSATLRRRLYN
ncbi:hypothetical protein BGZ68_000136, partial [Mortierella alpina]